MCTQTSWGTLFSIQIRAAVLITIAYNVPQSIIDPEEQPLYVFLFACCPNHCIEMFFNTEEGKKSIQFDAMFHLHRAQLKLSWGYKNLFLCQYYHEEHAHYGPDILLNKFVLGVNTAGEAHLHRLKDGYCCVGEGHSHKG
ncbi:hypothetical protein FGO68_gene12584 [Halteria grandinella]|uniref:Uncharacterized protein n=1 Tax=Halteria grandinella TaxID=5974 RepID=A0A8J8NFC6_HALGN|nr:hypothetical protein FGO68_gene12584 [Halteria grandinella]